MERKASWVLIAVLMAACSGGGTEDDTTEATLPGTPPPTNTASNSPPSVTTRDVRVQVGEDISMTIAATDIDGDRVSFTKVSGPDWLTLTTNGNLTGPTSEDDTGTHELVIDASDGTDTTRASVTVTLFLDAVDYALKTGDYTFITEHSDTDVPTVLLDEIKAVRARQQAAIKEVFELNTDGSAKEDSLTSITWNPWTVQTTRLVPQYPYSFPLLRTNIGDTNDSDIPYFYYALLGEAKKARFLMLGANPMGDTYKSDVERHRLMKNVVNWVRANDSDEHLKVVFAHIENNEEANGLRTWLDGAFPDAVSYNGGSNCDGNALAACLTDDVDLMIVFQSSQSDEEADRVSDTIEEALDRGIGLIHLNRYREDTKLGTNLQTLLGGIQTSHILYTSTRISELSPLDDILGWEPELVGAIETLVTGVQAEALDYDLSVCTGPIECSENSAFKTEIYAALSSLGDYVRSINAAKVNPFAHYADNRFRAALALTGDYYRSLTTFPMPKETTPSHEIIRAFFGEFSAFTTRDSSPVLTDLGTFSRTDFGDGVSGETKLTLTRDHPFQTTGLFALPGQTFTVTRHDDADTTVSIQVNSLRWSSGAPFRTVDGTEYRRPFATNSYPTPVAKAATVSANGQTVELYDQVKINSPYGGPIHVYIGTADTEVDLTFSNVGQHPSWRTATDNEKFLIDLAGDAFEWVEIHTPYFTIHSKAKEVREVLKISRYSDPEKLSSLTTRYLRYWPNWLDGRTGQDIPENADLAAFQSANNLHKHTVSEAKRQVFVEQSSCELVCDGNPIFESSIAFDPLSDAHQKRVAQALIGWQLGDHGPTEGVSDLYISHSYFRRFQEAREEFDSCPSFPHEDLYGLIQDAHASGNPSQYIDAPIVQGDAEQNAFYVQLMAALQAQGQFEDGWKLWPRLSAMMRTFRLIKYEQGWLVRRAGLGFTGVDYKSFNSNWTDTDIRLIFLSWAAQRDLTAYYEMWGYEVTEIARAHLQTLSLTPLKPVFYAIPETGHCTGLAYDELPVDGVSAWPQ